MRKFKILTKEGCHRCKLLKDWFNSENIPFEEIIAQEDKKLQELIKDEKFRSKYCKDGGCKVYTLLLYITDTKQYYHKRMFGIGVIRGKFLKSILKIN